jgi:hypothetical protein
LESTQATKESSSRLRISPDLVPQKGVRCLVELCRKFIYEYDETGAPWSGPDWGLMFNEAGRRLQQALEEGSPRRLQQMSDQDQEQTYLLLIRVAYFFEPGELAESFFREQGCLQEQTRSENSTPAKAGTKRSLLGTDA